MLTKILKNKFIMVILGFVLVLVLLPTTKLGAQIVFEPPSRFNDVKEMVDAVVNALFFFALPLSLVMLIAAAFLFLTAEGEPQKIAKARTLVFYTIIAFVIVILAKAIASFIGFIVG